MSGGVPSCLRAELTTDFLVCASNEVLEGMFMEEASSVCVRWGGEYSFSNCVHTLTVAYNFVLAVC